MFRTYIQISIGRSIGLNPLNTKNAPAEIKKHDDNLFPVNVKRNGCLTSGSDF